MTRARDVGVVVVAVAAAFIALQGTPDVAIQLRWYVLPLYVPFGFECCMVHFALYKFGLVRRVRRIETMTFSTYF